MSFFFQRQLDVIMAILSGDCDIGVRDSQEASPLQVAARCWRSFGILQYQRGDHHHQACCCWGLE